MRTIVLIIGLAFALAALGAPGVRAEEGRETDPFYPSAERPTQAVPPPANAGWGRDPFSNPFGGAAARPREEAPRVGPAMLTGIIYGDKTRLAIIGGETVGEGGAVEGRKVVAIHRRSVVLLGPGGVREELFLKDFSIRK